MSSGFLRLRFQMDFRVMASTPSWNRFVAQGIQLPTWTFEAAENDELIFYRAMETTRAGDASARLFIRRGGPASIPKAFLEIAIRGKWQEKDEKHPPLGPVEHMVDEAEALLILLGVRRPRGRLVETYFTKK